MSLLDGWDVANAEEISFFVPTGVYEATVSDVDIKPGRKDPNAKFMVFSYLVDGFSFPVSEWKQLPSGSPAEWDKAPVQNGKSEEDIMKERLSYIKSRLKSLGVPAEYMNTISSDELVGIKVVVTISNTEDGDRTYSNVKKVVLPPSEDVEGAFGDVFDD
jgi:hypothetical protein